MIKEEFEIDVDSSITLVFNYLRDISKFKDALGFIKEIRLVKDNEYEAKIKLSFIPLALNSKIIRSEVKGGLSSIITYSIIHSSWPSFSYRLDFIITPSTTTTKIKGIISYTGYLEGSIRNNILEMVENLKKELKSSLEIQKYIRAEEEKKAQATPILDMLSMKTVFSKRISKAELKSVIERAVLESVESRVLLILSDNNSTVKMEFHNGDLIYSEGDINSLQDNNIIVLIKKRE